MKSSPAASVRSVVQVVRGQRASDGAGVKLLRVIGSQALPDLDPFLLLDEFRSDDAGDYIAGFPEHPHRGFETVTYMSVPLLGEQVERRRWVAIVVGLAGTLVLLRPTAANLATVGALAAVAAAVCYALSALTIRVLTRTDTTASMASNG